MWNFCSGYATLVSDDRLCPVLKIPESAPQPPIKSPTHPAKSIHPIFRRKRWIQKGRSRPKDFVLNVRSFLLGNMMLGDTYNLNTLVSTCWFKQYLEYIKIKTVQ